MITVVIIITGFLGATSVEGAVSTPAFCTDLFKLMPLGDSITVGKYSGHDTSNDPGAELDDIGYRKDLWDLLSGPWYRADFVGSASNGATFPFGYPEHEGHNGINADLVRDNLFGNGEDNWLNQNPPDVILLHIGTNDVNSPQTIDQIVEEVEEILDKIDAYQDSISPRKEVIVILAKIIDQVPHNQKVTDFNVLLEGMAKARSEFEIELYLVDMESGAGIDYANYSVGGDMYDKNHPYASGFNKMAKVWMRKIDEICGNLPQLVNPGGQISEEGDNISLELITNGSDIYSLTFSQSDLPPGLSINSSTGRISGTISNGAQSGSPYDVTVTLAYDYGEIDQVNFTWTVYKIRDIYLPMLVKQ
jgi:hypothetical protein